MTTASLATQKERVNMPILEKVLGKKSGGSAFSKIPTLQNGVEDAKGRIIALDKTHDSYHVELNKLEKERDRVHADSAKVRSRVEALLETL